MLKKTGKTFFHIFFISKSYIKNKKNMEQKFRKGNKSLDLGSATVQALHCAILSESEVSSYILS